MILISLYALYSLHITLGFLFTTENFTNTSNIYSVILMLCIFPLTTKLATTEQLFFDSLTKYVIGVACVFLAVVEPGWLFKWQFGITALVFFLSSLAVKRNYIVEMNIEDHLDRRRKQNYPI